MVIVLFVVVLKMMRVAPLAMLGAYAATFLVYWVALLAVRCRGVGGAQPLSVGRDVEREMHEIMA